MELEQEPAQAGYSAQGISAWLGSDGTYYLQPGSVGKGIGKHGLGIVVNSFGWSVS